jgi:hypothetical protein
MPCGAQLLGELACAVAGERAGKEVANFGWLGVALMAVSIPPTGFDPNFLADEFTQAGAIAVLIVERKVTCTEAARSQR